jgi:hypothetical protein
VPRLARACQPAVYMPSPTFREATDELCLSGRELSKIFDIPVQSVKQARLDPRAKGYRSPPAGWERVLAKLAREKGEKLEWLAKELEG